MNARPAARGALADALAGLLVLVYRPARAGGHALVARLAARYLGAGLSTKN